MEPTSERPLELLGQARRRALARLQGSTRRDYWVELGPPLTYLEVARIEDAFAPLPDALRAFLLVEGVGIAPSGHNGLCSPGLSSQNADPRRPFPFTDTVPQAKVDSHSRKKCHPLDGTLAMASEGCGTYAFIVVTGPALGSVWTDLSCVDEGFVRVADDFLAYYRMSIRADQDG